MKKSIIDTYETIYNVDIVVANKYATLEELKELYIFSDKVELDEGILNGDCTASTCYNKSNDKPVVLIKYNHPTKIKGKNKTLDFVNTVCHEAGHAVLDIYDFIGQNVNADSSEPFCYLLGYIAECVYKTLTKK
jgi:hypothetical protein